MLVSKSSILIIPDATKKESASGSPRVSFDAVSSFSPSRSRTISKSPISTGGFISEYQSDKGGKVSLEAYVSNNPIIVDQENLVDQMNNSDDRARGAYLALDKLYKSQDTVTIVHRFDSLNSYYLTSFEPILMPSDAIGFRLEFEEVRFATEKRVTLAIYMSDELAKGAGVEQNRGLNSKEGANDTDEEEAKTGWELVKSKFPTAFGVALESKEGLLPTTPIVEEVTP